MLSVPQRDTIPFQETVAWLHGVRLAGEPAVAAKARLLLLDTIACAVVGMAEPELKALTAELAATSPGRAQWPAADALSPGSATFVASMAACWHEACEGLARAHGRPGLHAIPVAVSLGLARGATLGAVLEAIVHGYEIGGRAGQAMRIRSGLHVDGTWGVFAAVAAAARLMNLTPEKTLHALAIAACQMPTSLYAPIAAGRTARNTYVGHAGLLALHVTAAARAGVTAPEDAFVQAAHVLGGTPPATSWPWAKAGEFLILQSYLKPFAAVRHVHYAAACALQRFAARGGDTAAIAALELHTYQEAMTYCGNRAASTAIQAQFSLTHGTAFAIRHGTLGPEAYAASVFTDPEHARLERLITLHVDPAIAHRGARLVVKTKDGHETYETATVPGDPENPLSTEAATAKALAYMTPVIGTSRANAIVAHVLHAAPEAAFAFPEAAVSARTVRG
ncbi:MAG: MmgE/PrpD family protein [Rhodospirillaceae bacterium]|nr:MmgE/PrpD family protein [Rhodospirillaceae bacterium]